MLNNIPSELRTLAQWVVAGYDKEPMNPRTGFRASVLDPTTWATFEEAKAANFPHVGFVLADDPFTIIDLDDPFERIDRKTREKSTIREGDADYEEAQARAARHRLIFDAFTGYAELSQSGRGVHIIVRGQVPSGVRRDKVEIYTQQRYMICTGNVLRREPITDHQVLLDRIHHEMASTVVDDSYTDEGQTLSDEHLMRMATTAANAEKFNALFTGDIQGYPSQSEADFALATIFCFYSKNDEQVIRLFRSSALGQRDKAQRDEYFIGRYGMLNKIRARQAAPRVDLTALLANAEVIASPTVTIEPDPVQHLVDRPQSPVSFPPGLIGGIADYIYSSAIRPVPEVALAAALAMGAGILGRSYNISGMGLNQYLILLAKTGTGKEGAAGGIEALISSLRSMLPAATDFIGPAAFASGQALIRVLGKKPCFVSVLGEFGLTLQQVCSRNASPSDVMLRKVLLDLFAKSGHTSTLRSSVYSDQEKNTEEVRAPNVTILGESTPENFYGALDSSHIAEGLVPRFTLLEYTGERPRRNPMAFHGPGQQLVLHLRAAVEIALQTRQNDTVCPVQMDRYAESLMDAFDVMADDNINSANGEAEIQLWNRSHVKVLKLAALLAVGCNLHQPVITQEIAQWAIDLVTNDVNRMTAKFNTGAIGQGDHQQEHDIRSAVDRYANLTAKQRTQYKVPKLLLDKSLLIPYSYLKRCLILRATFKNDKRGAVTALQIALRDVVNAGMLQQVPTDQAKKELGVDSPVYIKGESW